MKTNEISNSSTEKKLVLRNRFSEYYHNMINYLKSIFKKEKKYSDLKNKIEDEINIIENNLDEIKEIEETTFSKIVSSMPEIQEISKKDTNTSDNTKINKNDDIKKIEDFNQKYFNIKPECINLLVIDDLPILKNYLKQDCNIFYKKGNIERFLINNERTNEFGVEIVNNIKEIYNNLKNKCINEIFLSGTYVAYKVINTIENFSDYKKIDIAILDIILGGITINKNNNVIFYNGIDIAKVILEYNPDAKICFYTGCGLYDNDFETTEIKKLQENYKNIFVLKKLDDDDVKIKKLIQLFK